MAKTAVRRKKKSPKLAPQALPVALENFVEQSVEDYTQKEVPLGGYLILMATYAATFATLMRVIEKKQIETPTGFDFALTAIASYKLSRVVTMSFIGSPIRAPFTTRGQSLLGGEVQDHSRGHGLQRAVGNLLTCPFCFSVWSSTAFAFGHVLFPRSTKQATTILSIAAIGDILHTGYRDLRLASH